MNRIITIESEETVSTAEIQEVADKHSIFLRESVWEAFRAAERKEYEKAEALCCKILDSEVHPEIMMLLGTCYFLEGHMESARTVFSDLVSDFPERTEYSIYLGMTEHALGNYEAAAEELGRMYPVSEYYAFYYTSYGDSLQKIGRRKQARDVFYQEVLYYKTEGIIVSPIMLDGAFQNLLYLDVALGNGKYPEDVKDYYAFLEQAEMTEEMQSCLAGNIVYFCDLMSNKWYRPLFLELITFVKEKGYLAGGAFQETLESAFASWESFQYHEDRQISAIMEDYLETSYQRKYSIEDAILKEDRDLIIVKALSYEWYMCQYLPEHPGEEDYVKDTYPHTYMRCAEFFGEIGKDAAGTAEKRLDELLPYARGESRQKIKESMYLAYQKARAVKKEPAYVYDGEDTYRRMQPKVGRNDPCPCGSGKKYKKCCGK